MRLSCPPGSTAPLQTHPGSNHYPAQIKAPFGCGASRAEVSQSSLALHGLYQLSKDRNHRLLQLSLNLSRDINFLKEYCRCLQLELERVGFFRQKRFERLSRKQTAATIFDSYSDSSTLLEEWTSEGPLQEELLRLKMRNSNLEQQNKQLHSQITSERLRLHKSVQVQIGDLSKMAQESQVAQEQIKVLNKEVSYLRNVNAALQLQQQKKSIQAGILQASREVFGKIHEIMRKYRRKMNALADEKRDVERKYRLLKENMRIADNGCQPKLIELLTEKVETLQKLVEKQQLELEKTITAYESEITKIEERRREELEHFENERIGLESENLRLCIDVQKALNRQDSTNLLLVRERNTSERLSKQVVKLTQNINNIAIKQAEVRGTKLRIDSGVTKFYGDGFKVNRQQMYSQSNVKLSCHSAGFNLSNNENSNQSNFEYQFSEISETGPFEQPIPDMKRRKEEDQPKRKGLDNIRITYNSYLAPGTRSPAVGALGRVYDSAVQYKRKLVDSKPDASSHNHR